MIHHFPPRRSSVLGVNPEGSESLTVTVPLVGVPPVFVTVKAKLPGLPRTNVGALAVLEIVRTGPDVVLTVIDPVAGVVAPPPLTVAVFVNDAAAFAPTLTPSTITG